ncbi:MAG: T9SS type A sorting domain-containing protein, partial [Bacteroidales bacterium]|nr:T9SS type A sorting domain-containing protein [Bacteroidales bacterium]
GAFGGYVVFRFEDVVENDPENPYGVDFTIFGNAMQGLSEPGIVYVMNDKNQNGLADDTWYELAGSDHYFSTSLSQYEVNYINPHQHVATDIPWTDNQGNDGFIFANNTHTQPYYPMHDSFSFIDPDQYILAGSKIELPKDTTQLEITKFMQRSFGYADNQIIGTAPYTIPDNPYTNKKENSGGDPFDINWAVDSFGNYITLDKIHFIKVQTAVMQNGGWLGEASTEIRGAVDVAPNSSLQGPLDMIVIRDLPPILDTSHHQLEVFAFHKGHMQQDKEILFKTSMEEATIDENHLLTVGTSGALEITAILAEDTTVRTSVSTLVELPSAIGEHIFQQSSLIFPNPALNHINIKLKEKVRIDFYQANGNLIFSMPEYIPGKSIPIGDLPAGLYLIHIQAEHHNKTAKLIKQ